MGTSHPCKSKGNDCLEGSIGFPLLRLYRCMRMVCDISIGGREEPEGGLARLMSPATKYLRNLSKQLSFS